VPLSGRLENVAPVPAASTEMDITKYHHVIAILAFNSQNASAFERKHDARSLSHSRAMSQLFIWICF
jgi:hypothetical protein